MSRLKQTPATFMTTPRDKKKALRDNRDARPSIRIDRDTGMPVAEGMDGYEEALDYEEADEFDDGLFEGQAHQMPDGEDFFNGGF